MFKFLISKMVNETIMRNLTYGLAMAKWGGCHILLLKSNSKLDEFGEDNSFGALEIDLSYITIWETFIQKPHRTSGKNSGGMWPVCLAYLLCFFIPPLLRWHGGSAGAGQVWGPASVLLRSKGINLIWTSVVSRSDRLHGRVHGEGHYL